MAQVKFPSTPSEIKETGDKFFQKHKAEGANSLLRILPEHDYANLGDNDYAQWVALNAEANRLLEQSRLVREKRDKVWKNKLKTPLMMAKNVIVSASGETPTIAAEWGFPTVKNAQTQEEKDATKVAAATKTLEKAGKKAGAVKNGNTENEQTGTEKIP